MKIRLAAVMVALGVVSIFGQGATTRDIARVTFEKAKKVETVDGDLKGAIDLYRQVSESTDRELAVQAHLRMSSVYRKLDDVEGQARHELLARNLAEQGSAGSVQRVASKDVPVTSLVPLDDVFWYARRTYITPDGRYLSRYALSGETFVTDLSRARTDRLEHRPEHAMVSPDGRRIAMNTWNPDSMKYDLQVVDRRANAIPRTLATAEAFPSLLAWSHDSRSMLVLLPKRDESRGMRGQGANARPVFSEQVVMMSAEDGRVTPIGPARWGGYLNRPPKLSPDSRYIAYSSFVDEPTPGVTGRERVEALRSSVYVQAVDGSVPKEVVSGASHNESPVWTPDGRHLLFLSDRSGTFRLYSVAVENGEAKAQPSPVQGSQIAEAVVTIGVTNNGTFYYAKDSEGTDVYRTSFGPDGRVRGSATRISNNFENQLGHPAYSPTGDRIAFLRRLASGDYRVVIRDVNSGRERVYQQPFHLNDVTSPVWMPDGKGLLLHTVYGRDANNTETPAAITRLDLESGSVTSHRIPSLRPSTSSLAVSGDTVYFFVPRGGDIRALDLISGNVRSVWTAPAGTIPTSIALSPDLRTFAVATGDMSLGAVSTLARLGVDGTGYVELGRAMTPGIAWTPDGQSILYRDDNYRLMRIPATGGTPLFTGLTVFGFFGFSVRPPTGSEIAYGHETRPELWQMENVTSVLAR